MLNLKNSTLLLIAILCIAACKSTPKDGTTRNGFKFSRIVDGSGQAIKVGDVVSFTMDLYVDSTLVQSNKDPENLPVMQLPADWKTVMPINPFFDILSTAKVGDSIVMQIPTDSLPGNPMLQGKKFVKYAMAIKGAMDSLAYSKVLETKEKTRQSKISAQTSRVPELTALINTSLAQYKAKKLVTEKTKTGLQYQIITKGTGPVAKSGDMVKVDYYGVLLDGKEFDNSFKRGEAITFPVGQGNVIPGWDEALLLLPKGTKAILFIPAALGYGETGSGEIPANSELVFYIEVL
jgi:FKBP-type peptidyl-prolyl cis-trans isomerase FkpA